MGNVVASHSSVGNGMASKNIPTNLCADSHVILHPIVQGQLGHYTPEGLRDLRGTSPKDRVSSILNSLQTHAHKKKSDHILIMRWVCPTDTSTSGSMPWRKNKV